jgi:hypothetical protein
MAGKLGICTPVHQQSAWTNYIDTNWEYVI